jgi:hypothetical protein
VRFIDFLKATVLLSAGGATVLALVTVLSAAGRADAALVLFLAGWWLAAAALGGWLGRRAEANSAIARLLASARSTTTLPEQRPALMLLNRLWPLLLSTLLAVGLAFLAPQIPGIAAGFAIIWALSWRRQEAAVAAIEDRDGAAFHLEPTSPLKPIRLVRTPALRREVPPLVERARV